MASNDIRLRLGSMSKVEGAWRIRQLLLLGHSARMGQSFLPRKLLEVAHGGRRNRHMPLRAVRDSLAKGLKVLIDGADTRGSLNLWSVLNRSKWIGTSKERIRVERGAFDFGGSEHRSANESGRSNDDSENSSETLR